MHRRLTGARFIANADVIFNAQLVLSGNENKKKMIFEGTK
jgi:hypothetical protein